MHVPRRWVWWLSAALVLGCGPGNAGLRAKLHQRAAFDLQCDAVQLVPLERTGSTVVSYGALGCGQHVSYVLNVHTSSWLIQGSPSQVPPPTPPTGGDADAATGGAPGGMATAADGEADAATSASPGGTEGAATQRSE